MLQHATGDRNGGELSRDPSAEGYLKDAMADILCWAEIEGDVPTAASLELLGEARDLADALGGQVAALVLAAGEREDEWAALLGRHGAGCVLVVTHPLLDSYSVELYRDALAQCAAARACELILLPGSAHGGDLASQLAARLGAEIVGGCTHIAPAPTGAVRLTRPIYGDRLHEIYEYTPGQAAPLVATFQPGARGADPSPGGPPAPVERPAVVLEDGKPRSRWLGISPPDMDTVDIAEAERLVAAGLGLPLPGGLGLARELAELLGAALGATRPVVDKGFLPVERQIGTTGRAVAPRLYVALGISGASQHVGGIRGAETIVAVNVDRSAPMMAMADLAVVGDAARVVELLVERLEVRRGLPSTNSSRINE
jgi:electron transfer flavoprotein alpha subunit